MKSLKYIVALALAAGLFQACDLERYPLTDLSEETFWNSESNAELALTSLYRGSLTDGVEYNPSDWWSYHGMIMMEHLSDNAFDRRGENNPFFKISSGKLQTMLLLKGIGRRLISGSVIVTVSWSVSRIARNRKRKHG